MKKFALSVTALMVIAAGLAVIFMAIDEIVKGESGYFKQLLSIGVCAVAVNMSFFALMDIHRK